MSDQTNGSQEPPRPPDAGCYADLVKSLPKGIKHRSSVVSKAAARLAMAVFEKQPDWRDEAGVGIMVKYFADMAFAMGFGLALKTMATEFASVGEPIQKTRGTYFQYQLDVDQVIRDLESA